MTDEVTEERLAELQAECCALSEDNIRMVELLMEVVDSAAGPLLPDWLRAAIEGEIEEAGAYRQSAIDQAERRGREGARQNAMDL